MALVRADFERMQALCAEHEGEVLNTLGDGLLLCFPSAAQAVLFALDVQREFGTRKKVLPAERALEHRIGVHLGDVFRQAGGDVAGDGVNIAARLQTKAPPGGICLSQTVYDTVKGKVPMRARFAGRETLKNIAEPIPVWQVSAADVVAATGYRRWLREIRLPRLRTYRLVLASAAVLLAGTVIGVWVWSRQYAPVVQLASRVGVAVPDSKSIAVLPFTNMSDDRDTAYFADGVHEDLLTQLALLRDMKVVSRTSVMDYRDTKKNVRQVGAELGVGTLVEGSVRRSGIRVRVTAQLIDASTDKHIWAKSYDRELKDIFAIQSELATDIARELRLSLAPEQRNLLASRPTENLEAYDLLLRHLDLVNASAGTFRAATNLKKRIDLLTRAVTLDQQLALAWARLASDYAQYAVSWERTSDNMLKARSAMEQAQQLAPNDPRVALALGAYYNNVNDRVSASRMFADVLKAAPNNVEALSGLAHVYEEQFRHADAVALLEQAQLIDGRNFVVLSHLERLYLAHRHYDRALALRQKMIDLRPDDVDLQGRYQRYEYWRTGSWARYDEWRAKLPVDAARSSSTVRQIDIDRSAFRRDFKEVLRLTDLQSEDTHGVPSSVRTIYEGMTRAVALRAKGDRADANDQARTLLHQIDLALKEQQDSETLWSFKADMHALLGERSAALSAHSRAATLAGKNFGRVGASNFESALTVYALLGDRSKTLAELARELSVPGSGSWPHYYRTAYLELAFLWDDPQFLALVNDPRNNAPLAITNQKW